MPWATGRCPACGLRLGDRSGGVNKYKIIDEPEGIYRCRKCKTAIRNEGRVPGQGTRFTVVPHEHGEMKLEEIPRV